MVLLLMFIFSAHLISNGFFRMEGRYNWWRKENNHGRHF